MNTVTNLNCDRKQTSCIVSKVTESFDGVKRGSSVGVDPKFTCNRRRFGSIFFRSCRRAMLCLLLVFLSLYNVVCSLLVQLFKKVTHFNNCPSERFVLIIHTAASTNLWRFRIESYTKQITKIFSQLITGYFNVIYFRKFALYRESDLK